MFDIVHTQHPFGIGMHGAATAQRLQVPVISTFHTLYMEYAHYFPLLPNDMIVSTINQHLKQYYSRCQRVIVPSRESERRLVQIGVPPEKITVIPTGVPDAPPIALDEMEKARSEFHLPKDIPIILFVGRLAKEKNLALLIHAFARLRTALVAPEPIHLVLVGDGPYRETCEQLARDCGVADAVQFTGFLTKQQLAPLYAAATLFAFPSSSETQGVVLSEAQSFGLPCVVVRGGGASESVREGIDALVVEPLPETFSKAMADLINDPDQRHAFSIAAQTNPLRLTPEKMVDCIIDVYTSAIAQSHV
jgi:glycosyltransferase involved in cell wall biosynthesis